MTTTETHGFVLWAVPRFHRQIEAPKPPTALERKAQKPAEPAPQTPPPAQAGIPSTEPAAA